MMLSMTKVKVVNCMLLNCPELKNIIFPNAEKLAANEIDLEYLLKLEKCDLSKFYMICNFSLGDLATSYNLVYPNLTEHKGRSGKQDIFRLFSKYL